MPLIDSECEEGSTIKRKIDQTTIDDNATALKVQVLRDMADVMASEGARLNKLVVQMKRDSFNTGNDVTTHNSFTQCVICEDNMRLIETLKCENDKEVNKRERQTIELEELKKSINTLKIETANYRRVAEETKKKSEEDQQMYKHTVRNRDLLCDLLLSSSTSHPAHVKSIQSLSQLQKEFIRSYQSNAFTALRESLDRDPVFKQVYDLSNDEIENIMLSQIKPSHWIYPAVERHLERFICKFATELRLTAPWFICRSIREGLWFVRYGTKLKQNNDGMGMRSTCDAVAQMLKRFEKTPRTGSVEVNMMRATAVMCNEVLVSMQRIRSNELDELMQQHVMNSISP